MLVSLPGLNRSHELFASPRRTPTQGDDNVRGDRDVRFNGDFAPPNGGTA